LAMATIICSERNGARRLRHCRGAGSGVQEVHVGSQGFSVLHSGIEGCEPVEL
jgi:hypothetical protein